MRYLLIALLLVSCTTISIDDIIYPEANVISYHIDSPVHYDIESTLVIWVSRHTKKVELTFSYEVTRYIMGKGGQEFPVQDWEPVTYAYFKTTPDNKYFAPVIPVFFKIKNFPIGNYSVIIKASNKFREHQVTGSFRVRDKFQITP